MWAGQALQEEVQAHGLPGRKADVQLGSSRLSVQVTSICL